MFDLQGLSDTIKPSIEGLGYELWGLEWDAHGNAGTLRIFIDAEQGITVDDCGNVSRQVSAVLDVEDIITSNYNLEISSPGMARRLFTPEQYTKYIGERITVQLTKPLEGQRKFRGILQTVDATSISVLLEDGRAVEMHFSQIFKGKLAPVLN